MKEKQVVLVEFAPNSIIKDMDICGIFGTNENIVEVSKSEYRTQMYKYQKLNETNLTMTISR